MVNSLLLHPLTVEGGGEEYWDSLHVHNSQRTYSTFRVEVLRDCWLLAMKLHNSEKS